MKPKEKDTRYPFTYACDHLRSVVGFIHRECDYCGRTVEAGTKLSRSDAAQIFNEIAGILGMTEEDLAKKIADKYLTEVDKESDKVVNFVKSLVKKDKWY